MTQLALVVLLTAEVGHIDIRDGCAELAVDVVELRVGVVGVCIDVDEDVGDWQVVVLAVSGVAASVYVIELIFGQVGDVHLPA